MGDCLLPIFVHSGKRQISPSFCSLVGPCQEIKANFVFGTLKNTKKWKIGSVFIFILFPSTTKLRAQDCSLLTRRIIETAVNKKKAPTFYEYLFYKKQRVLILQLNNGLIKETYKYCKLFNCESEVKKVLNVFSKREPQTKKKSIGRSSSLKQGKTVKEMVNSTKLTRTNSSQNFTRTGIRMGYLGKKRSKRGRRKTK